MTSMVGTQYGAPNVVDPEGVEPSSYGLSFESQQHPIVGCYGIEP